MLEFPIDELFRRLAKFDAIREDKDMVIGFGVGFFYWHNDDIFFVTYRDHVIIEKKAFLPDSITLYPSTEIKNSSRKAITVPLYDENEKPIWRVLPTNSEQIFVSIPIPKATTEFDFTRYFFCGYPSTVCCISSIR
ncbi:MAG TPA: hypothetical protein VFG24_04775 [Nitrosopumilaceae archaeon]|nr:hypothetical protein [Nitrosopumilaceae archaeon]